MTFSLRSNRGIAVSAVATCAVIGATTPVWATSGSAHGNDSQDQRALALVKHDAATIAALRAEIDRLEATIAHDKLALAKERSAVAASTRAARAAGQVARREAHALSTAKKAARTAERARLARATPVSNPADIAVPFDPTARHRCHHGDPGNWAGADRHSWDGGSHDRGGYGGGSSR